ncbi:recombinase family protein [Peribacillus sp. NPDC097206]|uniref:recombinase family protein n=1 Tax=Peribacillus sp. NPDC097206 TaxID=3364398 RepID=UPI0038007FBD
MEQKRIGISYCRKSIKPKGAFDDKESILFQEERCVKYCEQHAIELAYRFSDIGYSGKTINRPELQQMLALIESGKEEITDLIFYTVDRLGRDFINNIDLVLQISQRVKNISFVVEGITNDHEYFKLILMMKSVLAEEERTLLLERVLAGRKAVVLNKKIFRGQHKPLGYSQKKKEQLVLSDIDETRDLQAIQSLEAVQFIFLGYLSNMSMTQIKNDLDKYYGLTKRGKKWSTKAVSYILRNDIYAGILSGKFRGEHYLIKSDNVEPLLSKDVYQYVQVKLKTEKTGRKPKNKYLPQLSLCVDCLQPLIKKNNYVTCTECEGKLEENTYINQVEYTLKNVFFNKVLDKEIPELWDGKMTNIFLKVKGLEDEIKQLKGRRKLMETMFYDDKKFLNRLITHNQSEMEKIEKDYEYARSFLQFLKSESVPELKERKNYVPKNSLLQIPYLVVVNFDSGDVFLKFHSCVFEEN